MAGQVISHWCNNSSSFCAFSLLAIFCILERKLPFFRSISINYCSGIVKCSECSDMLRKEMVCLWLVILKEFENDSSDDGEQLIASLLGMTPSMPALLSATPSSLFITKRKISLWTASLGSSLISS